MAVAAISATGARSDRTAAAVLRARVLAVASLLAVWEAVALSGLLFRDVVPPLEKIVAALARLVVDAQLYANLGTTALEVGVSLAIGVVAGVAVGVLLGGNRFLGRAFEPYLHYLGPTPKIIFFPIMIMWFGVGGGSKMAMGALSCFFPVALSTAVGMRGIDRTLIRVAESFGATRAQMLVKLYLPAMRAAMLTGLRLGLGVAIIGVLLAETKLSNKGLGYMVIQAYTRFDIAAMYALLIVVFMIAIVVNALLTRLTIQRR